eukprot:g35311.t1
MPKNTARMPLKSLFRSYLTRQGGGLRLSDGLGVYMSSWDYVALDPAPPSYSPKSKFGVFSVLLLSGVWLARTFLTQSQGVARTLLSQSEGYERTTRKSPSLLKAGLPPVLGVPHGRPPPQPPPKNSGLGAIPSLTERNVDHGNFSYNQSYSARLRALSLVLKTSEKSSSARLRALSLVLKTSEKAVEKMARIDPPLLNREIDTISVHLKALQTELCLAEGKARKLVQNWPKLLGYNPETVQFKVAELASMIGCSNKDIGKMVVGWPQMLGYNAGSMRSKIAELSNITNSSNKEVGKMVARWPPLLGFGAESISFKIRELCTMTGSTPEEVGRMIALFPQLLGLNGDSLREKVTTWQDVLHCTPADLREILKKHPTVLATSPDVVRARFVQVVDLLLEYAPPATSREAAERQALDMVKAFPLLLCLSFSKNVAPTMRFLMEETAVPYAEVVQHVRLLTFSLSKRIYPRHAFARLFGRSLNYLMVQQSDATFIKNFDPQLLPRYEEFKAAYEECEAKGERFDSEETWKKIMGLDHLPQYD